MIGTIKMVTGLVKYLVLRQLFGFCHILQRLIWKKNGTLSAIHKNQYNLHNYSMSAHRLKIKYGFMLDVITLVDQKNFLFLHEDFVHPTYVLQEEVTLLTVTDKDALFVEQLRGSVPPHAAKFSFMLNGQFATASKLIILPLWSLNRLVEETDQHHGKLVFLQNQARCGSTLMTRVFEYTGRCIGLSEPLSLLACSYYMHTKKIWSQAESKRIVKNVVRTLCKPKRQGTDEVLAFVIKPSSSGIMIADTLFELFPDDVHIFMYRHPIAVSQSMRRIAEGLPTSKLMFTLTNLRVPDGAARALQLAGCVHSDLKGWNPSTHTGLEVGYQLTSITVKYFLNFRRTGVIMHGIMYEDLCQNPKAVISAVMRLCSLPDYLVPPALEAMNHDSQEAAAFSRKNLQRCIPSPPQPTPEFLEAASKESAILGIPSIEEWTAEFRLPGSINI